jgi:hypothetical protein
MNLLRIFPLILFSTLVSVAVSQDTVVVQTLVFDSITKRRGTWQFPEGESFRKILMVHTLKCDPRTTHDQYDCGEWDYLTYNTVHYHTGVFDSTLYFQPDFTYINGITTDSILIRDTPAWTFYEKLHLRNYYADTVSLGQIVVGEGNLVSEAVFNTANTDSRAMFLWKPEELSAAGLTAGPITGVNLRVAQAGEDIRHLTIRMKAAAPDSLTPDTLITGAETVFFDSFHFSDTGWTTFPFYQSFDWDGSSGILAEFSFENPETGPVTTLYADDPGFNCGMIASGTNYAIDLDGRMDFLKIPPDVFFHGNFTIEAWIFKRNDNNWSRVFDFGNGPDASNVIVTFSNGTSGKLSVHVNNANGISRSIKTPNSLPLNEWIHVGITMTLGRITWIYLNGEQVYVGPLQTPDSVLRVNNYIGKSNWQADTYADAMIDELRIYNGSKEPQEIRHDMLHSVTDPHNDPDLLVYYRFDEGTGALTADGSSYDHDAACFGYPGWYRIPGPELHGDFEQVNLRPQIRFERLETTFLFTDTIVVRDSVADAGVQLVLYENEEDPTVPTDTIAVYEAGYRYVYREATRVDSVWYNYNEIRFKEMIPYYGKPFEILDNFEIGRYITPYGIGLSLGNQGFRWIYDVTDYAHLLQGMVDLSAGNQQELIDLKFLMIKGIPPRNVLSMDRIWGPLNSYLYKDLASDVVLQPETLPLLPGAEQFKVRTRLTGHGHNSNTGSYPHCCEWKDNTHYLFVDGQEAAAWHIFQVHDCALNPVYPQGGTWPGAREGWCPGDLVDVHDFEITEYIEGDSVTLDYNITPVPPNNLGMGWGNYVTDMMFFQYDGPNFSTDAEVYDVIMPTIYEYYSRTNPACQDPEIIIRNNGAENLTSLTFHYGVLGGEQQVFTWEGELKPNLSDTISLPVPGGWFWFGDSTKQFRVCISEPNGVSDEYPDNDCYQTTYRIPDMYDEPIIMYLKTNHQAYRYSLVVEDVYGNTVFSRDGLANDSLYKDTLNIPNGCYTLTLTDSEDMGLYYWAYTAQGTGAFRFYNLDGEIVKHFEAEFGRMIKYSFLQGDISYIEDPGTVNPITLYPNPADEKLHMQVVGSAGKYLLRLIDMHGITVLTKECDFVSAMNVTLDISGFTPGLYIFVVSDNDSAFTQKIIIH